ncbi:hypothetical protein JCM10212_002672 [Sporobolomyces blumeae]
MPHPTPVLKFESPPSSSSLSLSPASDPTSSTSPSPPLDLCERVEDDKPIVEGPSKRTTPCERCRQVRRACRWDEGSKSCVRCSEAGIACSGPKRRSKPAHEMIVSVAARCELPVVEIGPSSPESRWSTLHLSYSLQYHLVEAAIDLLGNSIDFGIVDYPISPLSLRLWFGEAPAPPTPVPPDDIWFLFEPENPLSTEPSRNLQTEWVPSLVAVWTHLQHVLAFAPAASTDQAVRYCWQRADELLSTYDTVIAQIADDPRLATMTHLRPRSFLHNLIYDELEGLRLLAACYRIVSSRTRGESGRMFCEAEGRVFAMLDRVSRRFRLTLSTAPTFVGGFSVGFHFVEIISLVSAGLLRRWAPLSPQACSQMVTGLRYISYGMPDACRLLQILDPHVVLWDEPTCIVDLEPEHSLQR